MFNMTHIRTLVAKQAKSTLDYNFEGDPRIATRGMLCYDIQ